MTKGVVIYALKKPAYGKMAWNLAVSIKANSPDIPVAVLVDEDAQKDKGVLSHLYDWQLKYFDSIIPMSNEDVYEGAKFMPGKTKLSGYKYFPFDENIIIDADSICIEPVDPLFKQCTKNIHSQVVGKFTHESKSWTCKWMAFDAVKSTFKLPAKFDIYEINSSFMYVKKSEQAEFFYRQALQNYTNAWNNNEVQKWGGGFPDELAFNVAFGQLGIDPTLSNQTGHSNEESLPIFFSTVFTNDWTYVHSKFQFLSLFGDGNFTAKELQNYYDRLMVGYGKKFGFMHQFKIGQLMKEKHVLSK